MSVREKIGNHPGIVLVAASIAIVAAAIWIFHTLHRVAAADHAPAAGQAFFTADDGATLFADDIGKIPPFDHDGREAVRAMVFTCDGGQHQWVQYLEKYSEDAKRQMEAAGGSDKAAQMEFRVDANSAMLVKSPGAAEWVSRSDFVHYQEICLPKPPAGMGDGPVELVQPGPGAGIQPREK